LRHAFVLRKYMCTNCFTQAYVHMLFYASIRAHIVLHKRTCTCCFKQAHVHMSYTRIRAHVVLSKHTRTMLCCTSCFEQAYVHMLCCTCCFKQAYVHMLFHASLRTHLVLCIHMSIRARRNNFHTFTLAVCKIVTQTLIFRNTCLHTNTDTSCAYTFMHTYIQ